MSLRIGISMREVNAIGYEEKRDAIARDWPNYMFNVFPNAKWTFIPNLGIKSVEYFQKWDLNALFLSGGDDIGVTQDRDNSEIELLKYALKKKIPIVAICRGMQLVHTFYKGQLTNGNNTFKTNHKATKHLVSLEGEQHMVNSFHTNKIVEETIHESFEITSRCIKDNSVEGFKNDKIITMMWHPERDKNYPKWNEELIKKFLQYED